jgi:uncharacterized integral membrane protein
MRERLRSLPEQGVYVVVGVIAIIVLYLIGFIVKNARDARIDFVLFSAKVPLIVLMLMMFVLGLACGMLVVMIAVRRRPGAAATIADDVVR